MTIPRLRPILRFLACSALAAGLLGSTPSQEIRPGSPVEREIASGESQVFSLDLAAGHVWRIAAEQRGIDIVFQATGPDGHTVAVDAPVDRQGTESLVVIPEVSGSWKIEARAHETGAPPGRYVLSIEELPQDDRRRIAAEQALTRAGQLYLDGKPESRKQAIAAYGEAREIWRSMGPPREEARALYGMAVLSRLVDDTARALALGQEVLPLWQSLGDRLQEAATRNEIGLDLWLLGRSGEARASFEQALAVQRESGDRYGEAVSLSNLCLMSLSQGELRAGADCYERAIPLLREVRAQALTGAALTSDGRAWDVLGEPDRARERYGQALEIQRATGNREGEARTLNNLGVLALEIGDFQEALADHGKALAIFQELGDRRWQARALANLGTVYHALGDLQQALTHYGQALHLWREVGDPRGEASTLTNLGLAQSQLGDARAALDLHRQALELSRKAGDRRGEGIALADLGRTSLALGDRSAALDALGQAIDRLHDLGDLAGEADARVRQGQALLAQNRPEEALASATRALDIARAARLPGAEALALDALARTERRLGHAAEARARAGETLDAIERLRTRIGNPDLRVSYSALKHQAYELLIDLQMEAHLDRAALETSERARARTLLELLGEAGVDPRQGIDPALLERRAALERRLSGKATRALGTLSAKDREELETEQAGLLRELDLVEAEIRERNPAWGALVRPQPLAAGEIQALLDPDTVLVVYSLGEEKSYVWAVTRDAIASRELPARGGIEAAARRLHERLSDLDAGADRAEAEREADALGRTLLGPRADRGDLLGRKRIVVIADGALHYLPFGVLRVLPAPGADAAPLLASHEVDYLPSASALAIQRRMLAGRKPAARRIAVLADPVFDARDPRVAGASPEGPGDPPLFERLSASRREAESIAAIAGSAGSAGSAESAPPGQSWLALDFQADREAVLGDRLSGFRILHFATHGVLDTEHPALSGLALSMVDAEGRPREGFLHLRDIYDLRLDADLVVLSGCRTALGKEVRGEGLIGLTRGFLYAGAPRVVASLWRVEDQATATLMTRFYQAMWKDGLPPAAALRAAQLAVRGERRWRAPYFWAGFVLEGDWR
jgi:CHAT domain-containing protein/tetratricopeptide (TPR) repeat protein